MTPTVSSPGNQHNHANDQQAIEQFRQATADHIDQLDSKHIDTSYNALIKQATYASDNKIALHIRYHYSDKRTYDITVAVINRFMQTHSDKFDIVVLDDDHDDVRVITFDAIPKQ